MAAAQALVDRGADVNLKGNDGTTALMLASIDVTSARVFPHVESKGSLAPILARAA